MFNKMQEMKAMVATTATDAAANVSNTMKQGVDSLSTAASTLSGAISEKAIRASTAQMCNILEIAVEELKLRPLSERPVSLTSIVNFGVASLEMQIHLTPSKAEIHEE